MSVNRELARIFDDMADILELEEVEWKPRAYRNAARSLLGLKKDVAKIYRKKGEKGLKEISGVGENLARHIIEYIETGKINKFDKLRKKYPAKLTSLMDIEGLGPKKLIKLRKKLKIGSEKDLEKAAKKHKIKGLEGFGAKTEQEILEAIKSHKQSRGRMLLNQAVPLAEEIIETLKQSSNVQQIDYVGSLRRMTDSIGDIDILAISRHHEKIINAFSRMGMVKKVLLKGSTKSSIILKEGNVHVDLRVIPKSSYAAALQYFTGSRAHNIEVRKIAIKKGFKLSEYGLFSKKTGKKINCRDEKALYRKLGLDYIAPELRENRGEIEAAKKGNLPNLVKLKNIKSDLQMHSTFSDGKNSVREMAERCKRLGYSYMAVTDHSQSSRIAKGMDVPKLKRLWKEIEKVSIPKLKILKGAEVDILKEGKLDYSDKILKELDIVIASVHSGFKMSKAEMTKRIIKAMENPNVTILGHPTGRLIGKRIGYEADFGKIFQAAEDNNVLIEINAHPERLDLNDDMILAAKDYKLKFCINTDSHSVADLDFMRYGVAQARRGWLEKKDVANTLPYKKFRKFL